MAIRDLRGKQVVVTGAASGIGRATAIAFAREGANIVAADLDEVALAGLKVEIEALSVSCMAQRLDVSDEAAVGRFAEAVEQSVGAPDVLVNNAGIGYLGLFLRSDLAHWKRVLDVNLMGLQLGEILGVDLDNVQREWVDPKRFAIDMEHGLRRRALTRTNGAIFHRGRIVARTPQRNRIARFNREGSPSKAFPSTTRFPSLPRSLAYYHSDRTHLSLG